MRIGIIDADLLGRKNHRFPKFRGFYVLLARWCNQPILFKKMSFREFCIADQKTIKTPGIKGSALKNLEWFDYKYPEISKRYFDLKYSDCSII